MKPSNCIVCKSNDFIFVFTEIDRYVNSNTKKFSIFKCRRCDLLTINPKINESENEIYYPNTYNPYLIEKKEVTLLSKIKKKIRDKIINFFKLDKIRYELDKFKEKEINYLDFGSGSGKNLLNMRHLFPKWHFFGFDVSEKARRNLDLNGFASIEKFNDIPNDYFSIINLSSVIEHLFDPKEVIINLSQKLKNDGLIIVKTPNSRSLGRMVFGKHWVHYDIPRHIYIFSSKNLKNFLNNLRFDVSKIVYSNSIAVELKSFYRFMNLKKRPRLHNLFSLIFLPIGVLLNIFSISSTMTFICKKND